MPRQIAPPPSGEFHIRLAQPFSGSILQLELHPFVI